MDHQDTAAEQVPSGAQIHVWLWLKRLAVLAALAALVVWVRLWVLAPEPIAVEVYVVAAGRVEETVTNSRAGTVRAHRRAELSPEVGGRVLALPFREGDRVEKGDVLLRLDDEMRRAELELATRDREAALAERDRVCTRAEQAVRDRERIRQLARDGIASSDLLDKAATEAQSLAAACKGAEVIVERAGAGVLVAEARLKKMVLRAPFDGVVAELQTEVGEWVTPSPPALPVPPVATFSTRTPFMSVRRWTRWTRPGSTVGRAFASLSIPMPVRTSAEPSRA